MIEKRRSSIMQMDPTTVAAESSASYEEELSVDKVVQAQTEELLMANGGIPRGNGILTAEVGITAERTPVPTAVGVAEQAASPPLTQPASGLAPQAVPAAPPQPLPPLVKRNVSGRYHSTGQVWQVELRCDVDGRHPLRRVSADYYSIAGATVHYFGSMRVDAPTISVTDTLITITGLGSYTWIDSTPKVKVTIPRTSIFQRPAPATLQHLSLNNTPGT